MSGVLEKLSRAEEQIGKMYGILSDLYAKVAAYYSRISADISRLGFEENTHRDMLKNEMTKV